MRKIKFKVGSRYNYNYGDNMNLTVLCKKISCSCDKFSGYGEFSLVGIEGNFNDKDTHYAMLNIRALSKGTSLLIKTSTNFNEEGAYDYEFVYLEDGMLCATEEVK